MSEVLLDMSRTTCERVLRWGDARGAVSVTARFDEPLDAASVRTIFEVLSHANGVARCELWSANDVSPGQAEEEKLRGGDRKIEACVIIDTLRLADAEDVCEKLNGAWGAAAELGIYHLLCELGSCSGSEVPTQERLGAQGNF